MHGPQAHKAHCKGPKASLQETSTQRVKHQGKWGHKPMKPTKERVRNYLYKKDQKHGKTQNKGLQQEEIKSEAW